VDGESNVHGLQERMRAVVNDMVGVEQILRREEEYGRDMVGEQDKNDQDVDQRDM
jgi:hypothetical protein